MLQVSHRINGAPASARAVRAWKDRHGWDNVESEETKVDEGQWIVNWTLKQPILQPVVSR